MDRAQELIRDAKTIAVVGVTTKRHRPANDIARYLVEQGFTVYLVNPTEVGAEMFGLPIYPTLASLPEPVDIVDIFRRPEDVPPVVAEAIATGAKAVWMQIGIVNEEAAEKARAAGLDVVMDRCTKVEHARLPASL